MSGEQQNAEEEQSRERQPIEETHMCRTDHAERRGELLLHGVAEGLRARSRHGEDGPEPACHDLFLLMIGSTDSR